MSKNNNKSHQSNRNTKYRNRNVATSKKGSYDARYSEDAKADSRNDIGWYTSSPNLLAASSSLPYNHLTGTVTYRGGYGGPNHKHYAVPGAISLSVIPGPGFAASATDPVNVASNAIYSFVRHQNSGHTNYDAPDLMMYLLAMDNAFTYLSWLQRLYGTIHMYSAVNRYVPRDLIEMQGVDYDDLVKNIAQFRYAINAAITRMGSFCVPANMPIFARHASLFGNYYIEGDTYREQMYMYTPELVYQFALNEDGSGMLGTVKLQSTTGYKHSVESLINIFTNLIDAIAYDEDMNIMSGDILKAYGSDALLKLALIPEMYVCVPQRNFEVLEQFQNSACYGMPAEDSLGITQDLSDMSGRLRYLPRWSMPTDGLNTPKGHVMGRDKLITTSNTNPTPEINMLNTRMIPAVSVNVNELYEVTGAYFKVGSELPVRYRVLYYTQTGDDPATRERLFADFTSLTGGNGKGLSTFIQNAYTNVSLLSNFKFAPEHTLYAINDSTLETQIFAPHFQVDTYTTVSMETLERMHEAALLGEWNVERLAISK